MSYVFALTLLSVCINGEGNEAFFVATNLKKKGKKLSYNP